VRWNEVKTYRRQVSEKDDVFMFRLHNVDPKAGFKAVIPVEIMDVKPWGDGVEIMLNVDSDVIITATEKKIPKLT